MRDRGHLGYCLLQMCSSKSKRNKSHFELLSRENVVIFSVINICKFFFSKVCDMTETHVRAHIHIDANSARCTTPDGNCFCSKLLL
ncbi:hypothetical protein T01_6535 [Trichinella spiralis]|uniref:Uncharacterized protein n=1 Tax=Trichinella spiralis TaxID=6334 RepID=A0A0V1BQ98_TRISP|nr:hypothetical protein T01_6535 [Trichinella spiralis]